MAAVQGIREKVHYPVYDALEVEPGKQLRDYAKSSTIKFFVDVQSKTKLETNLQSASLLPHFNTFEARAMRVVISDLPPEYPDADTDSSAVSTGDDSEGFDVTDGDGNKIAVTYSAGTYTAIVWTTGDAVTADLKLDLKTLMELLAEARESSDGETTLDITDDGVTLLQGTSAWTDDATDAVEAFGGEIVLTVADLEALINTLDKKAPPLEQISSNNGSGNVISKLVFNTVTTLYVGEKIMIEMPTWFFPGGAGAYSFTSNMVSHGEPTPVATFRFAEPIHIDRQQNFRVEMNIPDSDVYSEIQKIYGPLFIWVVIDGYMTRDVQ